MATISSAATSPTTANFGRLPAPVARFLTATAVPSLPVRRGVRARIVRCSAARGEPAGGIGHGAGAAILAAAAVMSSPRATALVDERMSTEGTGLSLGLSNNLLGWILVGVFALIWALYVVYTSTLDEDEDSGLSL